MVGSEGTGDTEEGGAKRVGRPEQTRRVQTGILVAAIVVAGTIAAVAPGIIERKAEYEKIYPGCWQLIGHDEHCEMTVNVAAFIRGK